MTASELNLKATATGDEEAYDLIKENLPDSYYIVRIGTNIYVFEV